MAHYKRGSGGNRLTYRRSHIIRNKVLRRGNGTSVGTGRTRTLTARVLRNAEIVDGVSLN